MRHPKGLYLLFATEMAERFSYYGMRALFMLYLVSAFYNSVDASHIYGSFTGLVYLSPLVGGYVADRYWGNRRSIIAGGCVMAIGQFLMFASACTVSRSLFADPATGGAVDPSVDNSLSLLLLFAGLTCLIIGNGFFKPNISTMVGDLYDPQDRRKDSAFTIFYMGINTGAFIAPFICGTVTSGADWTNPEGFKWGFFSAGVAMILSTLVFIWGKNKWLHTPDGTPVGLPARRALSAIRAAGGGGAGQSLTGFDRKKFRPRYVLSVVGLVLLLVLFSVGAEGFNDYISAAIYAVSIVLPVFIITDPALTVTERKHIGVIYIISIFVIFFWSAFEQAGSSLTLYADQQCDRTILGWEVPTAWFQSVNALVVVTFAPLMGLLWDFLAKNGREPSSPVKQAIGLFLLALGYLIIAFGTRGDGQAKSSMWWLVALYFTHSIGELALSPIGLSMVSRLSPTRLASLLMGVWFMSNAASNILSGKLAALRPTPDNPSPTFLSFQIDSLPDFFALFAIMAGISGFLLLCLCPLLKRMMASTDSNA